MSRHHLHLVSGNPDDTADWINVEPGLVRSVSVRGKPEPGGSKRAVTIPGRSFSQIVDANPKAEGWKKTVAKTARYTLIGKPPLTGPLGVRMVFTVERPKSVRRRFPTVKPDVLKLARSTEDALTGIVWVDDAQIVREIIEKRYGPEPGCEVTAWVIRDDGQDAPGGGAVDLGA